MCMHFNQKVDKKRQAIKNKQKIYGRLESLSYILKYVCKGSLMAN